MTALQFEDPPAPIAPLTWNLAETMYAMLKVWNDCCPDTPLADLAKWDDRQFHGYCNAVRAYPDAENLTDTMFRGLLEKIQKTGGPHEPLFYSTRRIVFG